MKTSGPARAAVAVIFVLWVSACVVAQTNPVSIGHADFRMSGGQGAVAVAGDYVYIANAYESFRIVDAFNPTNPVSVATTNGGPDQIYSKIRAA